MAKKSFGKFLAFATISGVVAAGVSYFLKYKSFNKELDQDFHDFEGDDEEDFDGSLPHESEDSKRTYVTLGEKKSPAADLCEEAEDTVKEAFDDAADFVKETVKDVKNDADTTIIEEDLSI